MYDDAHNFCVGTYVRPQRPCYLRGMRSSRFLVEGSRLGSSSVRRWDPLGIRFPRSLEMQMSHRKIHRTVGSCTTIGKGTRSAVAHTIVLDYLGPEICASRRQGKKSVSVSNSMKFGEDTSGKPQVAARSNAMRCVARWIQYGVSRSGTSLLWHKFAVPHSPHRREGPSP